MVIDKLDMLNQSQVLRYYDELDRDSKKKLLDQIDNLDMSVLDETNAVEQRGEIKPLSALTLQEIHKKKEKFNNIGVEAIQNGKIGCVLLAGGQGSRLGFDKPKGMFNIGENRDLYIFECLIHNLLEVVKKANAWIPLFIMTSVQNDVDTRSFLAEHNYFGYSKENVMFFVQEQLPTVDTQGKLMLSAKDTISTAPNGNGGWYASMVKSGVLKIVKDSQLEWLNVFAVDNVLQKMADPCFIGAVIDSQKESGSKVVAKADANVYLLK